MATPQSSPFRFQRASGIGSKRFRLAFDAMRHALAADPDLEPCVYCGAPANTIDHVPPQAARQQLISTGLATKYPFFTVPACKECNSALGKRGLFTVQARRLWVKRWLRRRYYHILRIPDWTDTELAQLSPAFRGYILRGVVLREWVAARVAYRP